MALEPQWSVDLEKRYYTFYLDVPRSIQVDGDVIEDSAIVEIPLEFIYLVLFHSITPHKA